jgi:hypothetical protein
MTAIGKLVARRGGLASALGENCAAADEVIE